MVLWRGFRGARLHAVQTAVGVLSLQLRGPDEGRMAPSGRASSRSGTRNRHENYRVVVIAMDGLVDPV